MASISWTMPSIQIRGGPMDGMTMNDDGSFTPTPEPTEESLRSMGFFGLRRKLLLAYISCDGASTIDELMAIHAEKWGTDRSQLPLYNERTQKRGRMGVCACANLNIDYSTGQVIGDPATQCFRTEDGTTAYKSCEQCDSPMYCSKACQEAHWPMHERDCSQQRDRWSNNKKSEKNMMKAMNDIMGSLH